jgi:hypothetical protein|tara:strand:- start:293 stop:457 length:165 start_codon:yes stop_codon:yes gene_type:complete
MNGELVDGRQSILETLPDHRADRCNQLLRNLPKEDLVHIMKAKIPTFLRIDKDI